MRQLGGSEGVVLLPGGQLAPQTVGGPGVQLLEVQRPVSGAGPPQEQRGAHQAAGQQQGDGQGHTAGHQDPEERGGRGGRQQGGGRQDCQVDRRRPGV